METETKPQDHAPIERTRSVLRVVYSVAGPLSPPPIVRVPASGMPVGRNIARGLQLDDVRLSRHHATVRALASGRLSITDQGSKNGSFVNGVRVDDQELANGDVVSLGDTCLVVSDEPPDEDALGVGSLVGDSAAMRRARTLVRRLARTNVTVLLVAETGCGKEVVARALHEASGLEGPFIAVNCSAIPESLFESQLFGHVAGAFTGATAHVGFFRAASGGTLFLDEVGELPRVVQAKLLRALEERAVVPLGSTKLLACPVRVVAATNRDLASDAESGAFRPDLLARLYEATIPLPPLRDRREDVLQLFSLVLDRDAASMPHALAEALLMHSWPFNVRELIATAREVVAASSGAAHLDVEAFRRRLCALGPPQARAPRTSPHARSGGGSLTPAELRSMLAEAGGTVSEVARSVGRSRRQVYRWIEKYGIRVEDFRR